MNTALLTQLGEALGCLTSRPLPDGRALGSSARKRPARPEKAARAAASPTKEAGLPDRCYYSGPLADLGPAPRPHVRDGMGWGYLDREASELAARGRADIIRYCEMLRRRPRTRELAAARRARSAS